MASEEQKQYEALVMDGQRRKLTTSNNTAVAHQTQDPSCESLAKVKEAILVGLTSQYDLDLFREAQVKACEVEVSHKKPRDIYICHGRSRVET